jgi:hypothetical protein
VKRTSKFNPGKLTYGSDNEESRLRLRELMLFVADRCQGDPNFGVTKLNKILFYCDFFAFARLGKPITGIPYNELTYGPVPTGAENARRKMEQDGDVFMSPQGYGPFRPKRMIPRRDADLTLFSGPEVALVDGIIEALSGATGSQLRDMSHGKAWQAVGMHQVIPYEAVFLSDEPYKEEDIAGAHELVVSGEIED